MAIEQQKFASNVIDEIKKSCDRIKTEQDGRKQLPVLSFGIQYLDDCLKGIRRGDFILLGAKSGRGKTQAAVICALANARHKRVHFFALEAELNEVERRIKYALVANHVYSSMREQFKHLTFNYMDWMEGDFNSILGPMESELNELVSEQFPGLQTYYPGTTKLTENNVEQVVLGIQNQTDLIIIDHLHYFDFEDENENRAMKSLMKKLKSLSENCSVPILLLAHLRKSDRRFKTLIPDIDDFHGSSDIAKIATKVILLAPANDTATTDIYKLPTYIAAVKNRWDMSRSMYTAVCGFDVKRNNYEKNYVLGRISNEEEFSPIEEEKKPYWAKNAFPQHKDPYEKVPAVEKKPSPSVQRSWFGDND